MPPSDALFRSIDALKQEFGIDLGTSEEDLIVELRRRRALLHPDKSGGVFLSKAADFQFARINEALQFLEKDQRVLTLIKSEDVVSISTMSKSESAVEQLRLSIEAGNQLKHVLGDDIKRSYRATQITSGACASAFAALIGFSSRLASNPVIAPVANSIAGRLVLQVLLGVCAVVFALTWLNESRVTKMMKFLTSDQGLSAVLFWRVNDGQNQEPKTEMMKSDIIEDIHQMGTRWHAFYRYRALRWVRRFLEVRIPTDFADHAAESILAELLRRGVISKNGMRGVHSLYLIERERALQVLEDRPDPSHPSFWLRRRHF